MEDELPKIIPTSSRSKIPRSLSYAAGAQMISLAWHDVPQFESLSLGFLCLCVAKALQHPEGPRQILTVTYNERAVDQFTPKIWEERGWTEPRWEVTVGVCRSEDAHEIREWLREVGFPQSREWLCQMELRQSERRYSHWSAFFDEETRLFSVSRKG